MQITRHFLETTPGPKDWFTGAVYIDTIATPSEASRVGAASVHFSPGARTAGHTHPLGQTKGVDDQGSPVTRGEHVTDDEDGAPPPIGG